MKLRTGVVRTALAAALVAAGFSNAQAAVRIWSSNSSTDYNLAGNWTAAVAPNGADEYSMGAVGTIDAILTANAPVNGLIFTDGRDVILDTSTFQLLPDGGAANDIAVTGAVSRNHTIRGDKTGTGDLVLNANSAFIVNVASGSSLTFDATIDNPGSGNTATRFIKSGPGLTELAADSSAIWASTGNPGASFTPVTVRAGVLTLSSVGARGASTNSVSAYQAAVGETGGQGGGTLRLAANFGDINDYGGTNNTQGFLELSGRGWTGGSFATGEGSLRNTVGDNFITTTNGGDVRFANNGDVAEDAVRIRVDSGTSLTISTPIINGALFNPVVPNFEKTGPGLLVFDTSAKSYTGNTVVMEGELRMNATYTGGGSFTVNSGATLGGTGSVGASSVLVNASGILAPGASIGALAAGSVSGAGTLAIEYSGDAGGDLIDLLNVSGNLDITSLAVDFSLITGGNPLDDSAVIFAKYGSLTGVAFAAESGTPTGYVIDYDYNDGLTSTNIALVPVPEPGTVVLAAIAVLGLGLSHRRLSKA